MKLLVNAAQMKAADQYTIQELGIASLELMERAANACVQTMQSENLDLSSVCVVCGSGNNGGDGFAIARILKNMGCSVDTYLVGNPEHCTPETREQIRRLQECGGKITEDIPQDNSYSIVIDAVFGVGLSRKIEGTYRQVIERMNQMQGTKFAVDIPSGLSASTGCVLGCAFHADDTVTFEVKKIGLELAQGRVYAGRVTVAEIGISHEPLLQDADVIHSFDREEYRRMLPERPEDSNKGSYGRLLVIAGSKGMAGAAYLNAHAAYMTGAGLVRIYTPKDNREILQTLLPEAIITAYDEFNKEEVLKLLKWADGVCIGSGIGRSTTSEKLLRTVIEYVDVPCLIDADGLNLLSDNKDLLDRLADRKFIFTPHMKEMSRLTGIPVEDLREDRIQILKKFADGYQVTCVLKDSRTLIADQANEICLNLTGNSAMAKAGSGDVLAGVIAGFMVQEKDMKKAARLGTYVHGLAGDLAKFEKGVYSVMARDLIEYISKALMKLEDE